MLFLWLWAGDLRSVLWVAVVPAFIAVALLAFGIDEPLTQAPVRRSAALQFAAIGRLPTGFWHLLVLTALFSLARLSEAFLVLRAQELKLTLLWIPLVMIVMSTVYSLSSYPAGLLASRLGKNVLLAASLLALAAATSALAWLPGTAGLWLGVALWGLHMGLSQGGLTAAVAEFAPVELRASAVGFFHFVTGMFQLLSGAIAGWLWTYHGSSTAFTAGTVFASLALAVLPVLAAQQRRHASPP